MRLQRQQCTTFVYEGLAALVKKRICHSTERMPNAYITEGEREGGNETKSQKKTLGETRKQRD